MNPCMISGSVSAGGFNELRAYNEQRQDLPSGRILALVGKWGWSLGVSGGAPAGGGVGRVADRVRLLKLVGLLVEHGSLARQRPDLDRRGGVAVGRGREDGHFGHV